MARAKKEAALTPEERLQAALVPDWEWPYKLPENWCWTALKNTTTLLNGDRGVNYPSKKDYLPDGVPFINAGAIVDGVLDRKEFNFISKQKYDSLRAGKVKQNDILYCLRGSLGKTAIVDFDGDGAISSSLCILRVNEATLVEYLYYLLNSEVISQQQDIAENGSAQPNLSAASVMQYSVPIAPLAEQQRIVDRIESLFAKLDEAKEKAQAVVDSFETRKAAILHKAFTGELTKKWRDNNRTSDSHLENISECDYVPQNECPCNLPENWKWVRLGALGYTNIGLTYSPKDKSEHGTIVLRSGNIQNGLMDYADVVRVDMKIPENKMCNKGDILICARNGSKSLVGKTAIVDADGMSYGAFMAIFRSKYNPFIYYFLNSHFFRDLIDQDVGTTTINQVTQAIIKNLAFPFAPEQEQAEIVYILDNLLAKEQQAKQAAEAVLEKIDLMKKAILARAFRGELGTNDPNDESAVELLKKIVDIPTEPKPAVKRKFIPKELEQKIKTDLERKIIKLYIQNETDYLTMNQLMGVSSKKFDILEALRNLQNRGILIKENDTYKLMG